MEILWILIPAPIVGYLLINGVRRIFSEDEQLVRKIFEVQPVTMVAGATALGSIIVWAVVEVLGLW